MEYSHFKEHTDRVVESCSRVIVGKEETVRADLLQLFRLRPRAFRGRAGNGKDHAFKGICKDCGQRV